MIGLHRNYRICNFAVDLYVEVYTVIGTVVLNGKKEEIELLNMLNFYK